MSPMNDVAQHVDNPDGRIGKIHSDFNQSRHRHYPHFIHSCFNLYNKI